MKQFLFKYQKEKKLQNATVHTKTPQDMFALSKYWKVNCKINFSALFLVAEYEEGDPDTDDESDEKEVTFSIKP